MILLDSSLSLLQKLSPCILIFAIIASIALIAILFSWKRTFKRLKQTKNERDSIEGEEQRMFDFLHNLGIALEKDHSESKLHRSTVEGILSLVNAVGGGIYILSQDKQFLQPAYLSQDCPQFIGLPMELAQKQKDNPEAMRSALHSAIRLSKIAKDEGVLGSVFSAGIPKLIPEMKNHEAFRDSFVQYDENVTAMMAPLAYAGKDIGLMAMARNKDDEPFSQHEFDLFKSASEQTAFALGNAKIHHEANQKQSMECEIRVAGDVQSILLPNKDPEIPGYNILGTNKPASIISGDYFDYIPLKNGKTAVVIADVSGKGVAAGLLMAMCRSVLRAEMRREEDPLVALSNLNKQIYSDIREDMFISLAMYILNDQDGSIQLVCAGHDKAPLYRSESGEIEWVKPPGLAIGLDDGDVFSRVTKLHDIELHSGDSLLIYTDGVTEALNPEQDEYGPDRMVSCLKASATQGATHIIESLQKDLETFVNGYRQMDDITTIAIEKK